MSGVTETLVPMQLCDIVRGAREPHTERHYGVVPSLKWWEKKLLLRCDSVHQVNLLNQPTTIDNLLSLAGYEEIRSTISGKFKGTWEAFRNAQHFLGRYTREKGRYLLTRASNELTDQRLFLSNLESLTEKFLEESFSHKLFNKTVSFFGIGGTFVLGMAGLIIYSAYLGGNMLDPKVQLCMLGTSLLTIPLLANGILGYMKTINWLANRDTRDIPSDVFDYVHGHEVSVALKEEILDRYLQGILDTHNPIDPRDFFPATDVTTTEPGSLVTFEAKPIDYFRTPHSQMEFEGKLFFGQVTKRSNELTDAEKRFLNYTGLGVQPKNKLGVGLFKADGEILEIRDSTPLSLLMDVNGRKVIVRAQDYEKLYDRLLRTYPDFELVQEKLGQVCERLSLNASDLFYSELLTQMQLPIDQRSGFKMHGILKTQGELPRIELIGYTMNDRYFPLRGYNVPKLLEAAQQGLGQLLEGTTGQIEGKQPKLLPEAKL